MNKQDTEKVVGAILAAYPSQATWFDADAIEGMVETWSQLLSDLDAQAVRAAVGVHCRRAPRMPSVAEIRELVASAGGAARPGGDAWGDVARLMRAGFSAHRPPAGADVTDPVTWRCIEQLGWRELCLSTNQVADRARFVELYDQLAAIARSTRTVGPAALERLQAAAAPHELVQSTAKALRSGGGS